MWPIVWRRLLSEPNGAAFILICGLLLILPQLIMPVYAQIYIDEVINNGMQELAETDALGHGHHHRTANNTSVFTTPGNTHLGTTPDTSLQRAFEHQMLSLPERFYSQRYASDIASRMDANASIAEFIGSRMIPMATSVVLLMFYLVLTILYSPWLRLLVMTTTAVNAAVVKANLKFKKIPISPCRKMAPKPKPPQSLPSAALKLSKLQHLRNDIFAVTQAIKAGS